MNRNYKIVFNTWAGAFFQKGGGEVQLLKSKEALEGKGCNITFFDQWRPQANFDILHQFSIETGVEHVIRKYKELEVKIALSTIMWTPPPVNTPDYYRVKFLLDSSDILFPNSNIESTNLSKHFSIDISKFHKTRNSISDFYQETGNEALFREKFGIKGKFVLSVANIDKRKNTLQLVNACKKIGIPLVSIGHIKDLPYYNEFKELYDNYVHLGAIEDEEILRSAYCACTVFALPSLCETPGIAALEAASQGAPIVITQEGCAQEYFQEHAFYVDPFSLSSIEEGISEALKKERSSELRKIVIEDYSWKRTAEEILSGYRKLVQV